MDTFTKILILCSVIVLAGYYINQYRKFLQQQEKLTWPRNISPCPDYWVHEGNNVCKNMYNVGTCPKGNDGVPVVQGSTNFGSKIYTGGDGKYQKCRWAKKCNISWEGIDKLCA